MAAGMAASDQLRRALALRGVSACQNLFAKQVAKACTTPNLRSHRDLLDSLAVVLRTARQTRDVELEKKAQRVLGLVHRREEQTHDELQEENSSSNPRARRRERKREYYRKRAASRRLREPPPTSKAFLDDLQCSALSHTLEGLGRTVQRFTGSHAMSSSLRRDPGRALQCLNAALHRSLGLEEEERPKEGAGQPLSGRILRTMRSWGLCPDAYTINAVLHHGHRRRVSSASSEEDDEDDDVSTSIRQLWLAGNPPDAYTASLLCAELHRRRAPAIEVLSMLRCLLDFGLEPEAESYDKVLRLCASQGEAELATRVFKEMDALGLRSRLTAHDHLALLRRLRGRVQRAEGGGGDGARAAVLSLFEDLEARVAREEADGADNSNASSLTRKIRKEIESLLDEQ